MGKREQNKAEKAMRILAAATALFDREPFDQVTTAEIARHADVAAGTLFRYAQTKSELLLLVFNERFEAALLQGEADAASCPDAIAQATALLQPAVRMAGERREAFRIYIREVLFGDQRTAAHHEAYRLVDRAERLLAQALSGAPLDPEQLPPVRALAHGRALFSLVFALYLRPSSVIVSADDEILRGAVALIHAGSGA